jgi:hypothetical protein
MSANPNVPTWTMPATVQTQTGPAAPATFPPDDLYDFQARDLVVGADGDVLEADGHASWMDSAMRAMEVQRFSSVLYDANYGCDYEGALSLTDRQHILSQLAQNITAALKPGPDGLTGAVIGLRLSWVGSVVTYSLTLAATDGQPVRLSGQFPPGMPGVAT